MKRIDKEKISTRVLVLLLIVSVIITVAGFLILGYMVFCIYLMTKWTAEELAAIGMIAWLLVDTY